MTATQPEGLDMTTLTDEQIYELAFKHCYATTAAGGFIFDRERGYMIEFARAVLSAQTTATDESTTVYDPARVREKFADYQSQIDGLKEELAQACAAFPQPALSVRQGDIDALFARVTEWVTANCIPFEKQNELFRILAASAQPVAQTERALTFEDRQTAVEVWEERIIADGRNISSREAACFEDGFEACRALLTAAQPASGSES